MNSRCEKQGLIDQILFTNIMFQIIEKLNYFLEILLLESLLAA